jgi:hypothetical protein
VFPGERIAIAVVGRFEKPQRLPWALAWRNEERFKFYLQSCVSSTQGRRLYFIIQSGEGCMNVDIVSLGVAQFRTREKQFTICSATGGLFFCGREEKTFTTDIEEAYFMSTMEEALESLSALRNLLSKENEMANLKEKEATVAKDKEKEPVKPVSYEYAVGDAVLAKIGGKPANFYKIDSKNVFGSRYRVNIWCEVQGLLGPVKKITQSYYVKYADNQIVDMK